MCNCKSYNWDIGFDPEIVMTWPFGDDEKQTVCVDACIAPVIKKLWESGINTVNSCCGHNRLEPSIIFEEHYLSESKAIEIRKIIKEIDDRNFELMCWERRSY